MKNIWKEDLFGLSECPSAKQKNPHAPIDWTICEKLKTLSEKDEIEPEEMKAILDECCYASLANTACMLMMDVIWKDMLEYKALQQVLK